MGQPKFSKKKYETPNHPWKEARIKSENELVAKYGLKNKREIWKAETALRKYRGQARELLAKVGSDDTQVKKEIHQLISHLTRYNILPINSTLDDVLALNSETFLSRRLQTLTYLKGLASTPKQARQLINHGHISIDGQRINVPGYKVSKDEENKIDYSIDSAINDHAHPARPSGDFVSKIKEPSDKPLPPQPTPSKKPEEKTPEKPKTEEPKPEQPKTEKPKEAKPETNKEEKPQETPAKPTKEESKEPSKETSKPAEKPEEKKEETKEGEQ